MTVTDLARAALALWLLTAVTVLLGMAYFRRYRLSRPPLGVMTLGDVVALLVGVILIPYLYLALPGWLVAAILALGACGILQMLMEPLLPVRGLSWLLAASVVAADVVLALRVGNGSLPFLAVNNLVLILLVVGVTNLWAQSGLRARDLAILAAALTLYDLIATALLPLTHDLIARLAGLPLTPMLAWPLPQGQWLGIGLGDLLLATVGPLVMRKAYGRRAGLLAIAIALAAVAAVLLVTTTGVYSGTFPVMVVLGPLLLAQYLAWRRLRGAERTTAQYLREEPAWPPHGPATMWPSRNTKETPWRAATGGPRVPPPSDVPIPTQSQ
jgi:hypothetical protein